MAENSTILIGTRTEPIGNPPSGKSYAWVDVAGHLWTKLDDGQVLDHGTTGVPSNVYAITYKNASYEMLVTDQAIITHQTTDITIKLPMSNTIPNDGYGREYIIVNLGTSGSVTIECTSPNLLSNGISKMMVPSSGSIRLAGAYPVLGLGWVRVNKVECYLQLRRSSSWPATSFTAYTGIPWDTLDENTDSNIFTWNSSSNQNRVYCNFTGRVHVNCHVSIDSTGGSSYTVAFRLYKNGTSEVAGSLGNVGNYQTEDCHIALPSNTISVTNGDYIELQLDHNSLTGGVSGAMISFRAEL